MNKTMNDKMKVIEGDPIGRSLGGFGLSIEECVHRNE